MRHWCLLIAVLLAVTGCAGRGATPGDVTRRPDFRWDRMTSTDPNGENLDIVRLEPGAAAELPVIEGPGEISRIWMTFSQEPRSHEAMVLEITWDDAAGPSVRAPLGLFFGIADRADVEVENDFLHVSKTESLNAFFPMPFRKSARIRVINESDRPAALYYIVEFKRYDHESGLRGARYFHAQYRQETPAVNRRPYLVLDTQGAGTFLGSNLAIGINSFGWWGEGDDIMTVDGRVSQGTGSEDYYGGAWGWAFQPAKGTRFGVPIATKPLEPGGVWSVYRFHSEAPIRFDDSFRFELEHGVDGYDGREPLTNSYHSVAFYYLEKPEAQAALPPAAERKIRTVPLPAHKPGEWLELENLHARRLVYSQPGGGSSVRSPREENAREVSGGAELLLTAFTSDAHFTIPIEFPAGSGGVWRPTLLMTEEPQGVDFQLALNGEPIGSPISAYAPKRGSRTVDLPAVSIPAGLAMLEVDVTGSDPRAATPALFIGLDAVRFTRVGDALPRTVASIPTPALIELRRQGDSIVNAGRLGPKVTLESGADITTTQTLGLRLKGDRARAIVDSQAGEWTGSRLEVDVTVIPDPSMGARRAALFNRNLVVGGWLRDGAVIFWIRDTSFRYLYLQTEPGLIPAGVPSRIRFSLDGTTASIHVNGAIVRSLDMKEFDRVNAYPGRWIIGNTEELTAPFTGTIDHFRLATPASR